MNVNPLTLLVLSCTILAAQEPDGQALQQKAEAALFQHQVRPARQFLEEAILALPAGEDRGLAQAQLATLAWRYARDPQAAARHFQAAAQDLPRWKVLQLQARWRCEEGDLRASLQLCQEALTQAATEKDREAIRRTALHTVAPALRPGAQSLEPGDLAFLKSTVEALPALQSKSRSEWHERLDLALLRGQSVETLQAWEALVPQDEGGVGRPLRAESQRLLSGPSGLERLSPEQRQQWVRILAQSRLHPEAAWVARTQQVDSPVARDEIAYAQFLTDLEQSTALYYQQVAAEKPDRTAWMNRFEAQQKTLVAHLDWHGASAPEWTEAALKRELADRFGAYLNFGITGGVHDLHFGHITQNLAWKPSQYGHALNRSFRLVTLDFQVSNGFESWLWDGRASHGGWSDPTAVYRWASNKPWGATWWANLTEEKARATWQEKQARLKALDAARPKTAPMDSLGGQAERLEAQGAGQLLARLRGQGLEGAALQQAFLAECEHSQDESSIMAHEGRHALDQHAFWTRIADLFTRGRNLEYRAKLSEIALAPIPFFAFGGILVDNVGDATHHGQANARVLKGLGAWVEAHAGQLQGYSATYPAWLQLELLSADQLRAAARSLDPWARDPQGATR